MGQKGFAPILILIIALVVIGGILGGSYLLNRSLKETIPGNTNQTRINSPTEKSSRSSAYPSATQPLLKESKSSDAKGKLAFISGGEIWKINSDGSGSNQLTNDENNKFHLSISPDGKNIAYGFYPKDEKKRTNMGYYVGYNSGLALFNIESKETKVLIPYGSIQNHYPIWSEDNKYVSVWVGNGLGAKLIDIFSGVEVLSLKGTTDSPISPIIWEPNTGRVSFVENKSLVTTSIDGSNKQTLATEVDSLRIIHEGPNIPEPPLWSPSGRYVIFYKKGNLHLMDVINKTDVLVEKGEKEEMFNQIYPQAYPIGFNSDETKLYMYDSAKQKDTVVLDIKTGEIQEIAKLGQTLIMSPDKQTLLGQIYDNNGKIVIINLSDYSQKECPGKFDYSYYSWAGGTGYTFRFDTWSPDNKSIIGYIDYGSKGLNIFNASDCSVFNLVTDKTVSSSDAIWFP